MPPRDAGKVFLFRETDMKLLPSFAVSHGAAADGRTDAGDGEAAAASACPLPPSPAHLSSTGLPARLPLLQAETILGPAYFFANATGYLLNIHPCYVARKCARFFSD